MQTLAIILSIIVIVSSATGIFFTLRTRRILRAMNDEARSNGGVLIRYPASFRYLTEDDINPPREEKESN